MKFIASWLSLKKIALQIFLKKHILGDEGGGR